MPPLSLCVVVVVQVNDLWSIDLSGKDGFTWHQVHAVGERPGVRELHSACVLGSRYLVVHAGYEMESDAINTTYVLDTQPVPMVWTRPTLTGTRPTSRHGHALLRLVDDEALVFGGLSMMGFEDDVHILQLAVGNGAHYDLDHKLD